MWPVSTHNSNVPDVLFCCFVTATHTHIHTHTHTHTQMIDSVTVHYGALTTSWQYHDFPLFSTVLVLPPSHFSSPTRHPSVSRIVTPHFLFPPPTQSRLSIQYPIPPSLLPSSLTSYSPFRPTIWGSRNVSPLHGDPESKEWTSQCEPITATGTVWHFYYVSPQETTWANVKKQFHIWDNMLFPLAECETRKVMVVLFFYASSTVRSSSGQNHR